MVLVISELNGLQSYATDISNAYLEAHTTEKLWIIAPPKFGPQAGNLLIVNNDDNLMYDVLNGKSVTDCFHMANLTPMMWYSKKQATSETTTYEDEFLAARKCTEQVVDLCNSF